MHFTSQKKRTEKKLIEHLNLHIESKGVRA